MFIFRSIVTDIQKDITTVKAWKRCPSGRMKEYHIIRTAPFQYHFYSNMELLDQSTSAILEQELKQEGVF